MRHNLQQEFEANKHRGMEEFKTPMPRREVCGEEVCFDRSQEYHQEDVRKQRDHELTAERSRNSKER